MAFGHEIQYEDFGQTIEADDQQSTIDASLDGQSKPGCLFPALYLKNCCPVLTARLLLK